VSTGLVCWQKPPCVSDPVATCKLNDAAVLSKVRKRAMQSLPSWGLPKNHSLHRLRVVHPSIFGEIMEMAGCGRFFDYLELDVEYEDERLEKGLRHAGWQFLNWSQQQLLSSAYSVHGDRCVEHVVPWLCQDDASEARSKSLVSFKTDNLVLQCSGGLASPQPHPVNTGKSARVLAEETCITREGGLGMSEWEATDAAAWAQRTLVLRLSRGFGPGGA
jgi:hypothetical protein